MVIFRPSITIVKKLLVHLVSNRSFLYIYNSNIKFSLINYFLIESLFFNNHFPPNLIQDNSTQNYLPNLNQGLFKCNKRLVLRFQGEDICLEKALYFLG